MSGDLDALLAAEAQLLAPGSPFALQDGEAFGAPVRLPTMRAPHLRALLEASAAHGDAEYLVAYDGQTRRALTYAEHLQQVRALAHRFATEYGIEKGDRVAILGANAPEWISSFWATVSLGAVAVGMNGWWTEDEIRYALGHAEPKLLIADEKRLARLGEGGTGGVPILRFEHDFSDLAEAEAPPLPETPIAPEDDAIILYTSGTTGRPKGAVHAHLNVCCMVCMSFFHGARVVMTHPPAGFTPEAPPPNIILVTSPLFHVSGLHAAAITALAGGATTVWPMGRFDAGRVLDIMEREHVTSWGYTETVLRRLLAHPRVAEADLSAVRIIGGGGSPISPALQRQARAAMPQVHDTMGVGYGLTESTAFTTLIPGDELLAYPESVGRPLPGVEVEIRDEAGLSLPDGEVGEVCVHGPLVMKGYFRDDEATRASITADRWLRTGDFGYLRDGRLYLASRRHDLILRGGENVYPAEIEQRLTAHADVVEAAVVGVPHDELGQAVKAIVVMREGCPLDRDALSAWVGDALAYFKVPAEWEARTEPLPRNATGKVVKPALMDAAQARFIEE